MKNLYFTLFIGMCILYIHTTSVMGKAIRDARESAAEMRQHECPKPPKKGASLGMRYVLNETPSTTQTPFQF